MSFALSRRAFLGAVTAVAASSAFAAGSAPGKRALIIYYSRTGNTDALARMIQARTGADLLRLDVKEPYAESYGDMTYIARDEVRRGARRELSTAVPDLSGYDVVFFGSPYWWGSLSVPAQTFLMDHPLSGKTVYPFITSGSSSPEGALRRLRELCPEAKVGEHFYASDSEAQSSQAEVEAWLRRIGA